MLHSEQQAFAKCPTRYTSFEFIFQFSYKRFFFLCYFSIFIKKFRAKHTCDTSISGLGRWGSDGEDTAGEAEMAELLESDLSLTEVGGGGDEERRERERRRRGVSERRAAVTRAMRLSNGVVVARHVF